MRLRNAIAGFGASLLSAALLSSGSAVAQGAGQPDRVPLIMTKLPPSGSAKYKAIISKAGKARGQVLTLTKTEMWEVPKENVEAVKKAAGEHGAVATQLGADYNEMFHPAPVDMRMSPKQSGMMEMAKASKSTMGVGMMATPMAPMVEYALTKDAGPNIGGPATSPGAARVKVKLSDATTLTIVRTNVDIRKDMCIWRGVVEGTDAPATIMWWPGGKMAGTVQHQGRIYSLRHMGGDMMAVVEMAEDKMPQEHAPMPERMRNDPNVKDDPLRNEGDGSIMRPVTQGMRPPRALQDGKKKGKKVEAGDKAGTKVASAAAAAKTAKGGKAAEKGPEPIVIDVLVAYTKKAAAAYADVKRELVDLSIEEANESFRTSGVGHVKLRLVHAYQTDYVEEGAHFDHVWRFADKGDGYMEEVFGLREKHKADVALLIVDDAKGCGLATRVYADADEAFAVVHQECAATSYTVAHEIGHLIGARHDLALDKNMNPFPYGHGYVNGQKWRDIMSYKDSCGGCPRIPVWSSPLIKVKGEAAGTPDLDNARVIAEQAKRVAGFR
jgi:metallopeptidase family M12-like protein